MRWIERLYVPWLWLAFVLAMALQVTSWWRGRTPLDTDILALLPGTQVSSEADRARQRLLESGQRRLVALVGGGTPEAAVHGADAYVRALERAHAPVKVETGSQLENWSEWEAFYARYRHALLSAAQRRELEKTSPESLAQRALSRLYSPLSTPGSVGFAEDPFELFAGWQVDQAVLSKVRPIDGRLMVTEKERHYAVVPMNIEGSPFDREIQVRLLPALQDARREARQAEGVDVLEAGVVLHAGAATQQARKEISLVGGGSLLGILLLSWFSFSSWRATWLAQLPMVVGVLAGLACCGLVFGRVHLLTLVFGASLLSVADDYSLHTLCNAASDVRSERFQRLRELIPGMTVAWGSTALAYLAFAIPDFPALRQMALFSIVGLLATWATVLFWFPWLMRGGLNANSTPVRLLGGIRESLDRIGDRPRALGLVVVLVLAVPGLLRLHANDDVRLLQSSPPTLTEQQALVSRLVGLPAAGQFLLVRAGDVQTLLEREEALRVHLDELQREGLIAGYQAVSQSLPSVSRQRRDHALIRDRIFANGGALARLSSEAGLDSAWTGRLRADHEANNGRWLEPAGWLSSDVSGPLRPLWLGCDTGGCASVILLREIHGRAGLDALNRTAVQEQGGEWVDTVAQASSLLRRYRTDMMVMISVAYALVLVGLARRYRAGALRIVAPTLLGSVLTLAIFGWLDIELNLFVVLALILVLGMGLDYGVYIHEGGRNPMRSWIGVSLSALTTLLGFGLLAFSRTPALHDFGLTMLIGIGLAWTLAGIAGPRPGSASAGLAEAKPGHGH